MTVCFRSKALHLQHLREEPDLPSQILHSAVKSGLTQLKKVSTAHAADLQQSFPFSIPVKSGQHA